MTEYLIKNTKKDEQVFIYPECIAPNFLADRRTDNKFYSLIPLYIETFGEENIIERLKLKKPECIIISTYNTSNYYYSYFGQDYAGYIYEYILENYKKEIVIGKPFAFIVFKRK